MNKHKLLREDILPAMASNRKVQRLLNEFMDLLSEYETNLEQKNPQPALDKTQDDPAVTAQNNLVVELAVDAVQHATTATPMELPADQGQMNVDPPAS